MPRGRSRYATPGPRAGSVLLDTGRGTRRRRRGRRRGRGGGFGWNRLFRWLFVLLILAAVAGGVYLWRARENAVDARQNAAQRFAAAWAKRDSKAMWDELTPGAQKANPERRFVTAYANADRAAGVEAVRVGPVGKEHDGKIAVPVIIRTDIFGRLRGTMQLPVSGKGDAAGVDWNFALRLPGLGADEAVVRRAGREPRRAMITAADGSALDATPIGAAIAGRSGENPTGLERVYDARLGGHPSAKLMFGDRVDRAHEAVRGRPVHTTLQPRLMQAAKPGARRQARRRRGDPPARRRRAGARRSGGVVPAAAGFDLQDHHHVGGARPQGRDARHHLSRCAAAAMLSGVQAAQRRRGVVRRLAHAVVHRLLQLGVRAARRQGRRATPGRGGQGVRLQREAARSPPPSRARSRRPTSSRTTSRSAQPRSGRTATSRRRCGMASVGATIALGGRHAQPRVDDAAEGRAPPRGRAPRGRPGDRDDEGRRPLAAPARRPRSRA